MKLGDGTARDKLGRFYAYYCEDELRDALAAAKLVVFETTTGEDPGLAGDIEPWIALACRHAN